MTPARVVWIKGGAWEEKRLAEKWARGLRDSGEGVARVVKEVWWQVEYAEKGR